MSESRAICQYAPIDDEPCGVEIVQDRTSYSGWRHIYDCDWLHWASPIKYGLGESETQRIFKAARCNGKAEVVKP